MAIKVGNSWVSEEAYAYAKNKMETENTAEGKKAEKGYGVLSELEEKYPDVKFSTNTAPFSAKGQNNIAVAPNILREMENNPEKRLEYEALIYDCAQGIKAGAFRHEGDIAGGFIINADGSLAAWGISQSKGTKKKTFLSLDKKDKDNWIKKIQEKIKENKKEKAKREKRAAKEAEKTALETRRGTKLDIRL